VPPRFEIIEHPADVGFIAHGATLEELFVNAALALASLACAPAEIAEREQREIVARAGDIESLLYAWLAEILAIADAEHLVFRRFVVTHFASAAAKTENEPREGLREEVHGIAFGEPFDRARHTAGTYLKAVTYHQFRIEQTPAGFRATVFLDL
jgi:SHS2 domain-containing protein